MDRKIPKPGEIYDHFKEKPYQIITVAIDSETGEKMVVYQALYGDFKTYVRPLEMFISEVDHLKYPDIKQQYRFELREVKEESKYLHLEKKSGTISSDAKAETSVRTEISQGKKSNSAEKVIDPEEVVMNTPEGEVNILLMKFLDAESYTKKLEVITSNMKHLNDRLITDMAVALDLTVDEGPLEQRISGLISCLQAMCRFENRRLR